MSTESPESVLANIILAYAKLVVRVGKRMYGPSERESRIVARDMLAAALMRRDMARLIAAPAPTCTGQRHTHDTIEECA